MFATADGFVGCGNDIPAVLDGKPLLSGFRLTFITSDEEHSSKFRRLRTDHLVIDHLVHAATRRHGQ